MMPAAAGAPASAAVRWLEMDLPLRGETAAPCEHRTEVCLKALSARVCQLQMSLQAWTGSSTGSEACCCTAVLPLWWRGRSAGPARLQWTATAANTYLRFPFVGFGTGTNASRPHMQHAACTGNGHLNAQVQRLQKPPSQTPALQRALCVVRAPYDQHVSAAYSPCLQLVGRPVGCPASELFETHFQTVWQ